ncbi:DUF4116 domain-containing protein, partial [Mycoplasma sp. 1012]
MENIDIKKEKEILIKILIKILKKIGVNLNKENKMSDEEFLTKTLSTPEIIFSIVAFAEEINQELIKEVKEFVIDVEIIKFLIENYINQTNDCNILFFMPEKLKNNKKFILELAKEYNYVLLFASEKLRNDKTFVLEVLKKDRWSSIYISNELKNDKEFILEAVKESGTALQYASDNLKNDKEFILKI